MRNSTAIGPPIGEARFQPHQCRVINRGCGQPIHPLGYRQKQVVRRGVRRAIGIDRQPKLGGRYTVERNSDIAGSKPLLQFRRAGKTEPEPDLPGEMPPTVDPDRAFIDILLGRAENEAPPECGLRTIQLSEAAWRSAAAGGVPTPIEEP